MKLKKNVKLALVDIIEFILITIWWNMYRTLTYDYRCMFTTLTVLGAICIRWCIYKEIISRYERCRFFGY